MRDRKPVKTPKLVRDYMPRIWAKYQDRVQYHTVEGKELRQALLDKVLEEAQEVFDDPCPEEFGDLLDVLEAAARAWGIDHLEIAKARLNKQADRGGFTKGIYLTSFEWGPLRQ